MNNKIAIILLLSLAVGGCTDFKPQVGPPWMQKMLTQGPDGPTNFKLGWRHGCETGISATANRLQRSFYKFRQDYRLAQDPTYYTAWKTSYNYCQRYTFNYLRRNLF
jgi:hypothetical protein